MYHYLKPWLNEDASCFKFELASHLFESSPLVYFLAMPGHKVQVSKFIFCVRLPLCKHYLTSSFVLLLDEDECSVNNGDCEFQCVNTKSSYFCSCRSGYSLSTDKHKCVDVNECDHNNQSCPGKRISALEDLMCLRLKARDAR